MNLLGSPARTLILIIGLMVAVFVLGTIGYMFAGWSLSDASYMVLLTVYTVGYSEVHPIDSDYLHTVTILIMVFGCTGMILFTGALVQFLTISQFQQIFGGRRMHHEIKKLSGHVIIVGFGRLGYMLARELKAGGQPFVVLDQDEKRVVEAQDHGYLAMIADATDETALQTAGLAQAHTLATVLPNDAANVFITLSGRALNPDIQIIARGEAAATEKKLIQAGANHVVQPAHIGAEQIADMILFPATALLLNASEEMKTLERNLHSLGLELQVIVMPEHGALTGLTIEEIESRAKSLFVVQLNRRHGEAIPTPDRTLKAEPGDGLVIVARGGLGLRALFDAPPEPTRTGRMSF